MYATELVEEKWAKRWVAGDITLMLHSYILMWCRKMIAFWKDTIAYLNLRQFLIFVDSVWFYSMETDKWTTEMDVFVLVSFIKRLDFQCWKDKFIASITRWIEDMMFFSQCLNELRFYMDNYKAINIFLWKQVAYKGTGICMCNFGIWLSLFSFLSFLFSSCCLI